MYCAVFLKCKYMQLFNMVQLIILVRVVSINVYVLGYLLLFKEVVVCYRKKCFLFRHKIGLACACYFNTSFFQQSNA